MNTTSARKGDTLAASILSEWHSEDLIAANSVGFRIGLLVSASLLRGDEAERLLTLRSDTYPGISFSTVMGAYGNGKETVLSAVDAIRMFTSPANDNIKRERFSVKWFKDIENVQLKSWVVDGYIAESEFDATVGKPGSGKSVIITDAMCHVAADKQWHGRDVEQGLVVYFAAERKLLTERRVAAFKKHHGLNDVPFVVVGGPLNLTSGLADAKALVVLIDSLEKECGHSCKWITIDTVSRTFGGGDQNASKDMGKFIQSIDEMIVRTKAHVTVIHHSPWNETRGKGAIDLDGAVDASFYVSKSGNGFLLKCDGTNDGDEGIVTKFKLQGVNLGQDAKGKPTDAPIVVPIDGNVVGLFNAEQAQDALKGQPAKAFECLLSVIAESGQSPAAGSPALSEGRKVVSKETWQKAFVTKSEAKPDSAAKTFGRVFRVLVASGQVKQSGIWCWVEQGTKPDISG